MRIPIDSQSTADLARQTALKLTEIRREFVPLQGNVYVCRLDGKLMRVTEARRIILARIADNESRQGKPAGLQG